MTMQSVSQFQHGFIGRRSTVSNLVHFAQHGAEKIDKSGRDVCGSHKSV